MRIDRGTLAAEMRVRDIDQTTLSYKAEISRATTSNILRGASCSPATAQKIADALGVTVESLLEDKAQ